MLGPVFEKVGANQIIRINITKIGASLVIRITISENWCKCVNRPMRFEPPISN